jgi:ribonucleoside-diphosphate reductase alpha chain
MQQHYKDRYLCYDLQGLAERVAHTLAYSEDERRLYEWLISTRTFLPAGNTLLAGVTDIAPNCCVLGRLDEENFSEMLELSKKLWRQRTGIGFDLSGMNDPVAALRRLSDANAAIELGHRPNRGNMATLEATHPRLREFVSCKDSGSAISNFNISVSVSNCLLDDALLRCIAEQAWKTGDPGLIFLDRLRNHGPVHAVGLPPIVTVVPCGEQGMHRFETCNLGSINLNSPELLKSGSDSELCTETLRRVVHAAVQLMDSVVDKLVYPDERIRQVSLGARRIGLGVMGWADYLKKAKIAYDSDEAVDLASSLSWIITEFAQEKSRELARQLGSCAHSSEYRNISLTCIAPTGGITGLTTNSGYAIEPFFSEATVIKPAAHMLMQAAWQSGLHNAVSKTVNLPHSATVEDVVAIYKEAMSPAQCLKGITVYRDQSKLMQPMSLCPSCQ